MNATTTPSKPIAIASIVKFQGGWYRVSRLTKNTVNLSGVFGGKVYHKGVSITDVVEDEESWRADWTQSESYQSM